MLKLEVHDNLAEQPSKIFAELVETPRLCMLLNPKLTKRQVGALSKTFYVVKLKHEGKPRLAVVCGFYKRPLEETVEPQIDVAEEDFWQNYYLSTLRRKT